MLNDKTKKTMKTLKEQIEIKGEKFDLQLDRYLQITRKGGASKFNGNDLRDFLSELPFLTKMENGELRVKYNASIPNFNPMKPRDEMQAQYNNYYQQIEAEQSQKLSDILNLINKF